MWQNRAPAREGIALLSKVDWKAKGLQDLGPPDGFNERQVDHWIGLFERIRKGARVTAVASSTAKLDAAVLDPVGGALSEPVLRALHRGGRFVTIGYASGTIPCIPLNLLLVNGVQILGFQFQDIEPTEFSRNETELADLLASGAVTPHIGASFPLTETAATLRHVTDGHAIGK